MKKIMFTDFFNPSGNVTYIKEAKNRREWLENQSVHWKGISNRNKHTKGAEIKAHIFTKINAHFLFPLILFC